MSTLQLPPDTEKMRNFLFEMPVPFSIRANAFEKYWPLVDNVWSRYDEINVIGRSVDSKIPYNSIRFTCRFARRLDLEPSQMKPQTKRPRREGGTCSCRVKAKYFHGVKGLPDHYRFRALKLERKRLDPRSYHRRVGSIKINSFLKAAAAIEVAKGYMPAEAYKNLRSIQMADANGITTGGALDAAGGKYMTRSHISHAKQSALSATRGKLITQYAVDSRLSRKRSNSEGRVSHLAQITSVDPRTVWPTALGKRSEDR